MHNFGALIRYEFKKLFRHRILWITFGIFMVLCIFIQFASFVNVSTDNEKDYYELLMENKADSKAISGKKIDSELIQEYQNSGKRIPNGLEYFFYAIFEKDNLDGITEKETYEARRENAEKNWKRNMLTSKETEYMEKLERELDIPFTYQYSDGYKTMLAMIYLIGIMQTLFVGICIPSIFAEEHVFKMDQLILSSRLGKGPSFLAKTLVGTVTAAGVSICMIAAAIIPNLFIYGAEGFHAQIQLILPVCSYAFTMGEVLLILIGLSILGAVLQSAIAMLLSEKFRSSVGTMAFFSGGAILILSVNIPDQIRVLSQIWNALPNNIVAIWGVLDERQVPWFGGFLSPWQIVPPVYLFLTIAVVLILYRAYCNCQVEN